MKNTIVYFASLVLFTLCLPLISPAELSFEVNHEILTIQNDNLRVVFNDIDKSFSVFREKQCFVSDAVIATNPDSGIGRVVKIHDAFGEGYAIVVNHPSGQIDTIALYDNLPFVFSRISFFNNTQEDTAIETVPALRASADMQTPLNDLRVFGCESIQTLDQKRTSYSFLTVTQPESRASIVCGYLTHITGSGIVMAEPDGGQAKLTARTEYGKLRLAPGDSREGEILVLGYFDDGLDGLESYADAIATIHDITLPPVPSGYCTWYHARASDEQKMAGLAEFCKNGLNEYGFNFMQIDDFWQVSTVRERRDFTAHKPDGPYPSGMKATADKITQNGFTAGLWLIPFAWNPEAPALVDHPEWFMKNKDGEINLVSWAGYCLDNTHPETRAFIAEVISRITNEWGYKYLKLDGLWSGMGTKQLYPEPDYRPDRLGEAVLHDKYKTQIEAYRMGLENVRKAAGDDVFLLGCNIAQNMRTMGGSFGLVDGMRVGRDCGARWDKLVPCAALASSLYFFHGRVWYNDPDCLMLRDPLTLDQARAWGSLIGLSGQLNIVSEWLPGLPEEKLDVFKRTLPNHGLCARPADLFESSIARIWHLSIGEGDGKREIIGLFNWDDANSASITLELDKVGLEGSYVGFDFWEDQFMTNFSDTKEFEMRPSSCRILCLIPAADHPQLVSTSRHITQGGIDISELNWNAEKKILSGISKVIGGDPYQLRILLPETGDWQAQSAAIDGNTLPVNQSGREIRISILRDNTEEVEWNVRF